MVIESNIGWLTIAPMGNTLTALTVTALMACRILPAADTIPASRVEPVTDTLHETKITDLYRWLEDQDSPQTGPGSMRKTNTPRRTSRASTAATSCGSAWKHCAATIRDPFQWPARAGTTMFGAVICEFPLLDMLRYQKFKVGSYWITEYGSAEDPKQFPYLLKYSPYHNVEKGAKYPAAMFITGDADTRVDPLHARKMTALVQASSGSGRPVVLDYDTKAGHSGGKPLDKQIQDDANWLAFALAQLGVFPVK
jgi:protease II